MKRQRTLIRYIVSRYDAGETYDRLTHPQLFTYPPFYEGEILSFLDSEWAIWYATKRDWYVFLNTVIEKPGIVYNPIRVDKRLSRESIKTVFATVVSDPTHLEVLADCFANGLSPREYEYKITPRNTRKKKK